MGRINKATREVEDAFKPHTLVISKALWDKFKILAAAKALTLNDYIVYLVNKEVESKRDALIAVQQ